MSQPLLEQEMTVSQILRTYGKQFTQIRWQYSDGLDGRCAIGAIMSYYGWNGRDGSETTTRLALKHEGVSMRLVMAINDTGATFDEIADYLDRRPKPDVAFKSIKLLTWWTIALGRVFLKFWQPKQS
jgi:hypothetical protein